MSEDQKFIDIARDAVDWHNLVHRRRRWRDGKGVVHALAAVESVSVPDGMRTVIGTRPSCGYPRRSTVEHDPALAPTCLWCASWALAQPAVVPIVGGFV